MRILVTGATGLVGRRLVIDRLERRDHVVAVSRDGERAARLFAADANPRVQIVEGNPSTPGSWQEAVDGCDAVVHLAGAGVADRRWTSSYKQVLVNSRVDSTYQVVRAVNDASSRPGLLICASAVGYYGDTRDMGTDENAPAGDDFLAELSQRWEIQARRVDESATRLVILRIGVVLDARGGMLGRLLPLFRLGLGGPWCSGRQYVPWVHWRDLVRMADFALATPDARGVYNATAPVPVTAREFARSLGQAVRRPALLWTPTPLVRAAVGPMAQAMAASARVIPARLEAQGFRFLYRELREALPSLVSRAEPAEPDATQTAASSSAAAPDAGAGRTQPPGSVRLLVIDVDGTLLRSDGRLSTGVIQACRSAEHAGAVVVLATARAPRGLRAIIHALEIVAPTINYNGAVIWNPMDERAQHHQPLAGATARRIVEEARRIDPHLVVGLEVLDRWYTDRVDQRLLDRAGLSAEPDYIGPLDRYLEQPVTRLDLAGPAERIAVVQQMIREQYWRRREVAVFHTDPHVLQITHALVDKGIAVQRIAARLGLDRAAVMAIGDAENDLGMMEWAGFSVAVDNASAAVKALADEIVPGNDDQGVARAIHRFVLRGDRAATPPPARPVHGD